MTLFFFLLPLFPIHKEKHQLVLMFDVLSMSLVLTSHDEQSKCTLVLREKK